MDIKTINKMCVTGYYFYNRNWNYILIDPEEDKFFQTYLKSFKNYSCENRKSYLGS